MKTVNLGHSGNSAMTAFGDRNAIRPGGKQPVCPHADLLIKALVALGLINEDEEFSWIFFCGSWRPSGGFADSAEGIFSNPLVSKGIAERGCIRVIERLLDGGHPKLAREISLAITGEDATADREDFLGSYGLLARPMSECPRAPYNEH